MMVIQNNAVKDRRMFENVENIGIFVNPSENVKKCRIMWKNIGKCSKCKKTKEYREKFMKKEKFRNM